MTVRPGGRHPGALPFPSPAGHLAMTTLDVFTSWIAWPFWAVTVAGVAYWAWEKATGSEP